MKKLLATGLALLLLLSLAACGDSAPGGESSGTPSGAAAPSGSSAAAPGSSSAAAPANSSTASDKITDCAGVYDFYEALTDAVSNKMDELVDLHNEAAGDDFTKMVSLLYMPFNALRYLDAVYFASGTSPSTVQASIRLLGNEDAIVTEDGDGYIITYTARDYSTDETYAYKEIIRYDTDAPALSVVHYRDGDLSSFTEFQALGGDRYALSTEIDRAIVSYKGGEILAIDHAVNNWEYNYETGEYEDFSFFFDHESGAVFGHTGADHDWVMEAQQHDGLFRHYALDNGVCVITGLKKDRNWDTGEYIFTPGYELVLP